MEAHGLTKRFGDFTAVDHVSFTIQKGEIFGFLGSNGCGKSTTMKMLTGLLEATEGDATLLGKPIDAGGLDTKMRVGYMSQAFSLYEELSVRRNLDLHARLYQMGAKGAAAVEEALQQFDLADVADTAPASLPLGIRQRLQLAAACLHHPEVLILDEPTSGVDPAARDMFWRHLLKLSREDKITIFVSTHFMNEAARCDRISFMHKGRVLAVGTPAELAARQNAPDLEEAFVQYLIEAEGGEGEERSSRQEAAHSESDQREFHQDVDGVREQGSHTLPAETPTVGYSAQATHAEVASDDRHSELSDNLQGKDIGSSETQNGVREQSSHTLRDNPNTQNFKYRFSMIWTFARREAKELLRDKIRLFFAVFGPLIIMASVSWGISFDVRNLKFAVYDRDQTAASRELVEYFDGSRYFLQQQPIQSEAEIDTVLKSSGAILVIDIPSGFGRDLARGLKPEVGFYVDGSMPFNATNIRGYIGSLITAYTKDRIAESGLPVSLKAPAGIEPRFMYNQDFDSINAIAPGVMMLVLMMIPAMMSAVGVVREREIGSIANFYASPAAVAQYLIGKQLPYIAVGMVNFAAMMLMIIYLFGVPLKGSFAGLAVGTLLMVSASTALGLLISCFVRSQLAAIFATAIITMIPAQTYSGFLYPLSTMEGGALIIGKTFPSSWYYTVSVGSFTKGLHTADLLHEYAAIAAFAATSLILACVLLKKQER